jgi:hypothetical protein
LCTAQAARQWQQPARKRHSRLTCYRTDDSYDSGFCKVRNERFDGADLFAPSDDFAPAAIAGYSAPGTSAQADSAITHGKRAANGRLCGLAEVS